MKKHDKPPTGQTKGGRQVGTDVASRWKPYLLSHGKKVKKK